MAQRNVVTGSSISSRYGTPRPFSPEADDDAAPALAQIVAYECPAEHLTNLRFHISADVPDQWPCARCDEQATRDGHTPAEREPDQDKPVHPGGWFSLRHLNTAKKRRNPDEQEALLAERMIVARKAREVSA